MTTTPVNADATETGAIDTPVPRSRLALVAKLFVSGALLALLVSQTDVSRLAAVLKRTSVPWLFAALGCYLLMVLTSVWRWQQLLGAIRVVVSPGLLLRSYLVATFFNNFFPSNVGGDVVRIKDTSGSTGSRTTAALVVGMDRLLGLLGLLAVAAVGATAAARASEVKGPLWPPLLWLALVGVATLTFLLVWVPERVTAALHPLKRLHQEWVEVRLARVSDGLSRFGSEPLALVRCLIGAVIVQLVLVAFYAAVAKSIGIGVPLLHLAVLVPVSFVVQMLPVSVNGLGVREAVFSYYLLGLRLPLESGLILSLLGAGVVLVFSLSGAVVYATRR
jgi:uncharacterized membrane protein YbhN (UPF0104 family)